MRTLPAHRPMKSMAVVVVFLVCPAVFAKLNDQLQILIQCTKRNSRPGKQNGSEGLEALKDKVDGHEFLVVVVTRKSVERSRSRNGEHKNDQEDGGFSLVLLYKVGGTV
jgi:hypothetical protein